MKLLFDQNLSRHLVKMLEDVFSASSHVALCDLIEADDHVIWEYCRVNGFTIVSKDSDFFALAALHGSPPKVIQVVLGNCPTRQVETLFSLAQQEIAEFEANPDQTILRLG